MATKFTVQISDDFPVDDFFTELVMRMRGEGYLGSINSAGNQRAIMLLRRRGRIPSLLGLAEGLAVFALLEEGRVRRIRFTLYDPKRGGRIARLVLGLPFLLIPTVCSLIGLSETAKLEDRMTSIIQRAVARRLVGI